MNSWLGFALGNRGSFMAVSNIRRPSHLSVAFGNIFFAQLKYKSEGGATMQNNWALVFPEFIKAQQQREPAADISSLCSGCLSIWRRDKQLRRRLCYRPSETTSGIVIPLFPVHGWQLHPPACISRARPRSHAPLVTCTVGDVSDNWTSLLRWWPHLWRSGGAWTAGRKAVEDETMGWKTWNKIQYLAWKGSTGFHIIIELCSTRLFACVD